MSDVQRVELVKSRRNVAVELTSLAAYGVIIYFVLNRDKYERVSNAIQARANRFAHRVSVWQARWSIQSLPETDES